jgi:rSAM/selenodomain-associated transferase 1
MSDSLVLFAKPAKPGLAKSRLAASIGPVAAAKMAAAMLDDTLALCEGIVLDGSNRSPQLVLAYTQDADWFAPRLSSRWRSLLQEGAGLGSRLENALASLDPSGASRTVFVGMDAPHLPPERLRDAFAALDADQSATVLGPCEDGGYYLIGVRGRWPAGALEDIRWSTAEALTDTRAALGKHGIDCAMLPEWYDVDTIEELRRLAGELATMPPEHMRHVREALGQLS